MNFMKNRIIEIIEGCGADSDTANEAAEEIFSLVDVRLSLLSDKLEGGKSHWVDKYEDATTDSQHEMEGYQWALNDINESINGNEA